MVYVKFAKADVEVGAFIEYNIYVMHTQTIHKGTVEEVLDDEVVVDVPGKDYVHRVKYKDIRSVTNPKKEVEVPQEEKIVKIEPQEEFSLGNVVMEKRSHRDRFRRKP